MPFDALGGSTVVSLADLLTEIGVTPVPMNELEAHKIEQVRLHPPSVWLTPKPYATVGVLAFAALTLGGTHTVTQTFTNMLFAAGMAMMAAFTFMFVVGAILDVRRIKLRGKAQWIERHPYAEPMPEPVRKVMRQVHDRLPKARFVYGELIQRSQVLDPYLLVFMPVDAVKVPWAGQRACLAIWDDTGIIRIADVIE